MTDKEIRVRFILTEHGTWDVIWNEYLNGVEQSAGGAIGGAGYSLIQAIDKFKGYADAADFMIRKSEPE